MPGVRTSNVIVPYSNSHYARARSSLASLASILQSAAVSLFFYFAFFWGGKRTPLSAAAAFHFGWHFSHELCVAYAMIMSTAGLCTHFYTLSPYDFADLPIKCC